MPDAQVPSSVGNPGPSPAPDLPSPLLYSTAWIRRGPRTVLLYPWHKKPDPRPDLERISEGYAADSVEAWFPIDDHHWYFTRDDLGRLFQETTGIRGDLYLRKTTELRRWLARALDEGEVRAYWWAEPEMSLPSSSERQVALAMAGPGENAWYGMSDDKPEKAKPEPWPEHEPTSFDECEQRLVAAKTRMVITKGFQPKYSDADLVAMRDAPVKSRRFLVWIGVGIRDPNKEVGYRRDTGRTTAWTAPFSMVEDADLDAALICAKNGMTYEPENPYTMVLIDQSINAGGATNSIEIVPTFANMADLGVAQFVPPEIFSEAALRRAMTPDLNGQYSVLFPQLDAFAKSRKGSPFDQDEAKAFARTLDPAIQDQFVARHQYHAQFGANQHFLGNGFTAQLPVEGHPGTKKEYGVMETMTLDKDPLSIAQRAKLGGVRVLTIPAKVV